MDAREDLLQRREWRARAGLPLPAACTRHGRCRSFSILPAGDVDGGFRSSPDSMDDRMAPFVRAGRAAFGVVLEGYIERLRPANFVRPDPSTRRVRRNHHRPRDRFAPKPRLSRDALRHRQDPVGRIRSERRFGARPDSRALETRYRALLFVGAGLPGPIAHYRHGQSHQLCARTFAAPKLILQGRYDEDTPVRTATEPLFKLLSGTEAADPVRRRPRAVDRGRA